jgi:hypothetical protein
MIEIAFLEKKVVQNGAYQYKKMIIRKATCQRTTTKLA